MPSLRPVASSRPTRRGLAALAIAVLLGFAPGAAAPALAGPASVGPAAPEPATEAVTVEGTYELAVEDPHGGEHHDGEADAGPSVEGELETVPLLAVDDAVYELPEGAGDGVEPGSDVSLTLDVPVESAVEDVLEDLATAEAAVLDLVPTAPVGAESVEPGTAAAVTGLHTLTVLPVYWTQPDGTTPAALRTLAAETAAYWSEQSAGRITVQSDVRDWARIPAPVGCASARVFSDALAAHPGVASGSNQHVAVYFPRYAACPWAGLATLRGSMILLNGVPWLDVMAHELGHNLGLGHANRAVCTADGQRVPLSGSCTNEEYLDYADVMGIGMGGRPTGSLNSALATSLGLVDVRTAGTTATVVDLAPLGGAQGVRALRIPVGLGELFVDFRPAVGRDTRYSAWAGVQVHLRKVDGQGIPTSQLLDLQPSAGTFVTPQLGSAGWEVPGTGRTLRISALDAGRARVELTGQGDVVPGPPPAPPAPTAVSGAVVVTGGGGPVRDAVLQVRNASCSTVFSTMRTGADGTFPVTAYPGQYCLVPVSVPAPFALPGSQVFTVGSSGFSVPVALVGPSTGSVVVTGGGAPVAGAVLEVRNASCSTVFSRMRTGADGSFPVTAYPGQYCLVGVSVPAPFLVPGSQVFTVGSSGFSVPVALAGPSTGSVVVTGGGAPVAGAVLEVRNASCSTVFSRMRTGADGSFPVTAYPGQYCLVGVSAPAPFLVPGSQVFTVGSSGFSVPVALVGPSTGSVVVTGGGAPVAGAVLEVRNASCSTVFSRMRTGADGSFPVTAYPGQYCLVGVSAPAPFDVAGRQVFAVAGPGFTVPVSLGGPSSGSVRAVADGAPVPGVVVQVRNAACSATFSTMRTGADGAFPVVAYPGTYCLVPTSAPAGYVLPAGRTFTVAPDQRFAVDLTLARAR